ncbi:MAG: hypothetical protein ACP5PN_10870 [Steroidobacteraceae bacterium]
MRIAFLVLLLANLLFLAWTEWIAVPVSRSDPLTGLPRLRLVSRAVAPVPGAAAEQAPAGALGAALADQAAAPSSAQQADTPALQCFSVGPFARDREATEAAALLRSQHFLPQPRTAAVRPARWYWVYLPDISGSVRVRHVLAELHRDGIEGAEPMPAADGKPGISLGLFRDPALAHRQLTLARAKGFGGELTVRLVAQPAYWVDLWAAGGASALPMRALRTKFGAAVGAQTCPRGDTPPLPSNATGAVAPGVPLPGDEATAAPPP